MIRLLAVPAVVALLVAGLWFWAGVVAPGYWWSIGLGVAWFVVVGAITGKVAKIRPELKLAVRGPFIACAVAAVVGFYWTSIRETEVNERLETGVPASQAAPERVDDLLAPQP